MTVQQELERFTADVMYVENNREELLRQYSERWVAVYNKQVVGAAKHLKVLIKQLDRKGVSSAHAYVEYLTEKDIVLS